ncbi:hypothetical protein TSA1_26725 [Bradyrhizobium nitroreducens]|uniref:Uncharacterized protein n=1 Tax=Bradyrhizobium nitroreducens TaxID=709803 RepID=A0A2M6UH63_9BRAD|nr:hypothetical protein TSA1_26725 [Bradyrhizobium nitroreducens]
MLPLDDILAGQDASIDAKLLEQDSKCRPQLIQELAHAITACERSPLLPDEVEELSEIVADGESLRLEARKIKDILPFLLRTSSTEKLSELSVRLWACAGLAREVAELRADLRAVLQLITKFDDQIMDLAGHVEDMAAEAEISLS